MAKQVFKLVLKWKICSKVTKNEKSVARLLRWDLVKFGNSGWLSLLMRCNWAHTLLTQPQQLKSHDWLGRKRSSANEQAHFFFHLTQTMEITATQSNQVSNPPLYPRKKLVLTTNRIPPVTNISSPPAVHSSRRSSRTTTRWRPGRGGRRRR